MSQPRRAWQEGRFERLVTEAEAGGVLCTACGTPLHPLDGPVCWSCRRAAGAHQDPQETQG